MTNRLLKALPRQVIERAARIQATPELVEAAKKLILPAERNHDLRLMWRSIERAERARDNVGDDLWVLGFLRTATLAAEAAPFTKIPMRRRRTTANHIRKLASQFETLLKVNGLDSHVVRQPKRFDATWRFFEDMSEPNQRHCEAGREPKLQVSALVRAAAERAANRLECDLYGGKVGKRAAEVRFCRDLVVAMERDFGTSQYRAVAIAANAWYATEFTENSVRKLMIR
ncbi:hypothetical protein [Lysobacter sp. P5_B9]